MTVRLISGALLALIAIGAVVLVLAGTRQSSPNTIRVVISAQRVFCSDGGRFVWYGQTGWVPTAGCQWPPAVPSVRR
jgi:hypothetical protein